MEIVIAIALIVASIIAIGEGADWLTDSLSPVARRLGVTGSFVGLILVSAGVSLPEILVAVYASLQGHPALSLGVIIGSIMVNIGLMSGITALVRPLKVPTHLVLRDGLFSIVVPILVLAVASGGLISRIEGLAFLLLFIPYLVNVYLLEARASHDQKQMRMKEVETALNLVGFEFSNLKPGILAFILGLGIVLFGSQVFATQMITLVRAFAIPEVVIGLTLGAVGPSLPNIFAAYTAAKKGMGEIAVAETLGSNIFTLLVTLGITALISPVVVSSRWLDYDLPLMVAMSFLLFLFILTKKTLSKFEGAILLGAYLAILLVQLVVSY